MLFTGLGFKSRQERETNRIVLFTCERENEEFQSHLERVILEVLKAIQYWDSYAVLQAIFIYCVYFFISLQE